ncbi:MAG TPA: protein usg [Caulobacteraceae bacterium]
MRIPDPDFTARLEGRRLTTAEVLYYIPDHPSLLQSFLWQTLDVAPDFPRVHRFLDFWRAEIDAVIHSVQVTAAGLVTPAKLEFRQIQITIN